jgi:mannose-6-phosphate isomerase
MGELPMSQRIHPLTFEPVFRQYLWGGRNLETLFGRRLPPGIVAESWEISGHPSSTTRVLAGLWKGRTLPEVLDALGADLVGTRSAAMLEKRTFPLLVKLLDANKDLSVQVHPDDANARLHENGELGKAEMWYVLHAGPGTELIYGLARGATKESLCRAIERDALAAWLHRIPIEAGDCYFISPGTVHALLAGAVVAEIQQNSDITYRIHDWGRVGADGVGRPLHIDRALSAIDWDRVELQKSKPAIIFEGGGVRRSLLAQCPQFTVERIDLVEGAEFTGRCDGATFEIWGCVRGGIQIRWTGRPVAAYAIRFVLLPAVLGDFGVSAEQESTLLRAYVGAST